MPRNSSGVYQLPAGNPVVSGALVESVWANTTMSDIAQAVTDSLDRFGRSTMAAPMLLNDGTLAAPGLAFGAESSTGLFRKTSKVLGVAVGATEVATFTQTGLVLPLGATISGTFNVGNVAVGAGNTITGKGSTSGSWSIGASQPTGGVQIKGIGTTDAWVDLDAMPTNGALPATDAAYVRLFRATNTSGARQFQIYRGDGSVTVDHLFSGASAGLTAQISRMGGRTVIGTTTDNGVDLLQVSTSARVRSGAYGGGAANTTADEFVLESAASGGMSILTPASAFGNVAFGNPASVFAGGMQYDHAGGKLNLLAGGTVVAIASTAAFQNGGVFLANNDTAAAPGYSWTATTGMGMFRAGTNVLGFATAGVEKARFTGSATWSEFLIGQTVALNATANRGLLEINSPGTDVVIGLNLSGAKSSYLQANAGGCSVGTLVAQPMRFFTNSTEAGRFTSAAQGELIINGTSTAALTTTNRGLLVIDGSAGSCVGWLWGGVRAGYVYARSATEFAFSTGTASIAMTFMSGGVEVARVDTDATLQYTAPTIGQVEVGFRGMPVQSKSAAYTMRAIDRGCCVVQTAVAAVTTAAVFVAGDAVSVCNKSTGNISIFATGITLNWGTGTPLTGNRVLAVNGFATLFFTAANVATLTGTGIS